MNSFFVSTSPLIVELLGKTFNTRQDAIAAASVTVKNSIGARLEVWKYSGLPLTDLGAPMSVTTDNESYRIEWLQEKAGHSATLFTYSRSSNVWCWRPDEGRDRFAMRLLNALKGINSLLSQRRSRD